MGNDDSMQTISRAMQVLKLFSAEDKEFSLADFHRKLGISKSSLQRVLHALVAGGFLEKDEQRKIYKLGLELYFLGNLVQLNSSLLAASIPYMEKLRELTGETVTLNMLHQDRRKCIGYLPGTHELTTLTYIGHISPLYAGASAKILLAFLPEKERSRIINQLEFEQVAPNTVRDKDILQQQLTEIRQMGYAISQGERVNGAYSISAPIRNRFDAVVASLSITMPTIRVEPAQNENYIKWIVDCAADISNALRY